MKNKNNLRIPRTLFCYLGNFLSAFTKRVACPEGADLGFGGFPSKRKSVQVAPEHCLLLLYQIGYKSRYTKKSVIPKAQKSPLTTGLFTQKFGITDFEKRLKTHCQQIWQEEFGYSISHSIKLFKKLIVIDGAQYGVHYAGILPAHRFFNGIPLVLRICIPCVVVCILLKLILQERQLFACILSFLFVQTYTAEWLINMKVETTFYLAPARGFLCGSNGEIAGLSQDVRMFFQLLTLR